MKRGAYIPSALLFAAVYFAGCSSTTSSSTAASPGSIQPVVVTAPAPQAPSPAAIHQTAEQLEQSDTSLSRLVRDRLISPGDLPADQVQVQVHDRVVTLSGTVDTFLDKTRIEKIAKATDGVEKVLDQIQVNAASRPDADIQRDVTDALQHDPALAQSHLTAKVQHGVVTLEGVCTTWQEKDLATTRAENVAGVRQVNNTIHFVSAEDSAPSP